MKLSIEDDRLAHLMMRADSRTGYDEARRRLDRAVLVLTAGADAGSAWGQAALLTAAECGVRMFPGGVYLGSDFNETTVVGQFGRWPIKRHLERAGCLSLIPPEHAIELHVGSCHGRIQNGTRCWAEGWAGVVGMEAPADRPRGANEIGGVMAAAMGICEVFRRAVLGDKLACRRTSRLSALSPGSDDEDDFELAYLPKALWLLGLGNLGQATLWTIGLLPYSDPGEVSMFLQDVDKSEPGNLALQLLTKPGWIGHRKARNAAPWAEACGFETTIIESKFAEGTKRAASEPGLLLVGVDNLAARRAAASSNFELVIDAGLGATATEVFDLRIHGFPGARSPMQAWPEPEAQPDALFDGPLRELVKAGRIGHCGALTIAGRSLGLPSTAVTAAAIQVAQACRAIRNGSYFDLVDVTLVNPRRATGHRHELKRAGTLPYVPVRC